MRRFRIGGFLAAAIVVAAVPWSESPPRLPLASPPVGAQPLAFVWEPGGGRLARVDVSTLEPVGRTSESLGAVGPWSFSPDRSTLTYALRPAAAGGADQLRFVDVDTFRVADRTVQLAGSVSSLLWALPRRLVAVDCCAAGKAQIGITTIDPETGAVLARESVDGRIVHVARADARLVVLVAPTAAIAPARVLVVAADGSVATASVDGIRAGVVWRFPRGGVPVGQQRIPGLAVEPDGRHAYVLDADGTAADVELDSLTVAYHRLSAPATLLDRVDAWLQPAAQAKSLSGPARTARWLGDGLVAVTGNDERTTVEAKTRKIHGSSRPAGLRIVDTRDWSVRTLDPGVGEFRVADGLLLATGSTWSSDTSRRRGIGLVAFGSDGSPRVHALAGRAGWLSLVAGGRAYVYVDALQRVEVVDLATGAVVGERAVASLPLLLLGPASDWG